MSVKLVIKVWKDKRISGAARLVLLVLANKADGQGVCRLGYDHIAKLAGVSRRTAIGSVSWLEKHGFIVVKRSSMPGKGNESNWYRVVMRGPGP